MSEKSENTKRLEEAKIEDDPLYIKRAVRGAMLGMSKAADKVGIGTGKKEEPVKKAKGGMVKSSASKRADGVAIKGRTKGRFV